MQTCQQQQEGNDPQVLGSRPDPPHFPIQNDNNKANFPIPYISSSYKHTYIHKRYAFILDHVHAHLFVYKYMNTHTYTYMF